MKLLQESTAVVNIEDTHSEITVDNGRIIHCSTSGKGRISIFKLNGECIYTEEIQALKVTGGTADISASPTDSAAPF